jgi:putative peptidoglycan lipid II flippase
LYPPAGLDYTPTASIPMSSERHSPILRASVVSATGTGLARVLGALRDVVLSHVFGAGRASDAFWLAWTVPSIFRRFVADEGLTGALIPAVGRAEKEEGTAGARRLAGAALTALLLASAVICVGGVLAAPWLVKAFAYGFTSDPGKFELTVTLTRWLFPFVVFVSLVSYCESLLNYRGHFFVPKVAPGVVSGCIAAAALFLSSRFEEPVYSLVVGALAGGLVHLLICLPPLVTRWGAQRPSLSGLGTSRFRKLLGEMSKVVAIGVVAQANVVLLRLIASFLDEGSVTQYWYAARVVDLAQGAVAVGVGSALLPVISRDAAARRWDEFRAHFAEAVHLVALMMLPAAALLLGLAPSIVSILFRHGAFDAADAARTSATLQMLVPFMLALAGINILKKAFFALDDRTALLAVGAVGLVLTGGLGYPLASRLGVAGLGLTLSLSTILQLVAYLAILRRKMGTQLGLRELVAPLLKLLAAAVPAAALAVLICHAGDWDRGPASLANWLLLLAAGIAAGLVYVAVAWALDVKELRALLRRVWRTRQNR